MKKRTRFRFEIEHLKTEEKYCVRVYENGICQFAPRELSLHDALGRIADIITGVHDDVINKDRITIKLINI